MHYISGLIIIFSSIFILFCELDKRYEHKNKIYKEISLKHYVDLSILKDTLKTAKEGSLICLNQTCFTAKDENQIELINQSVIQRMSDNKIAVFEYREILQLIENTDSTNQDEKIEKEINRVKNLLKH